MAKPNLNSVLNVQDPMLSDNFDLKFESIPGRGSVRQFTIQCKTALKPGTALAETEVELFGHKVMHAARRTWNNDMSIEFIEDRKGSITKALEEWAEIIRGTLTQHGLFKRDYAVDAVFTIYNQAGSVAMVYKIINCWPSNVPDLQFDGSGGAAVQLQADFKFDHVIRIR